ncbi:MAG: toprim domain-containing protein [Sulfuritalea sp.]|nr:toprim domain-containing protein [Sulfuritalea sp.]
MTIAPIQGDISLAGIDSTRLKPGENRLPCPICDRGPKDTALSVRLEPDGAVIWHCHRLCGMDGSSRSRDHKTPPQARQAPPRPAERRRGLSDYARQLWTATRPVSGLAADYLQARACLLPPNDSDLRYMPALWHPSGYVGPALVALITDVCTAAPLSLHRTWIRQDGTKADINPPRLLLKDHPVAGGVIRLWPDDAVTAGLGIAEGIETALSLAHGFTPVWSLIDAGHLAKFPILNGIEELIIAADNDDAGRKAANECAARWADHAAVRIISADADGADLNDECRTWAT